MTLAAGARPLPFERRTVANLVPDRSGVYAIGPLVGGCVSPWRIGKSDRSLRRRLLGYLGNRKREFPGAKGCDLSRLSHFAFFELPAGDPCHRAECLLFHRFGPRFNPLHPNALPGHPNLCLVRGCDAPIRMQEARGILEQAGNEVTSVALARALRSIRKLLSVLESEAALDTAALEPTAREHHLRNDDGFRLISGALPRGQETLASTFWPELPSCKIRGSVEISFIGRLEKRPTRA